MLAVFDSFKEWVMSLIREQPLLGPSVLLLIEEIGVPLPIPGDVYIAYAGYQVSKGTILYIPTLLVLLSSVLLGSSILYYISYRYGESLVLRFGKFIHLNERKLKFIEHKFRKFGPLVIIIGRHIPGFRIPVTVFSGISKVSYKTFILSEFISVFIWIVVFLKVGEQLGRKTLTLFHSNYGLLFILLIPIVLTAVTFFFGKFIPEEE